MGRRLTVGLRNLFKDMSETLDAYDPILFLQLLRQAIPQFAQRSRESNAPAQQDAEECWSQILSILRTNLKSPSQQQKSFIDTYMAGTLSSTLTCNESTDEPAIHSTESFLKLECNISATTNFMRDGILAALTSQLEKRSEVLGRDAVWTKTSRITRLPKYLVVHFVRFYWKRDTNKKAKILRKVKFPLELDATEFCSDDLKKKTLPVRDAVREARRKFEEEERARKRARVQAEVDSTDGSSSEKKEGKSDEMDVDAVDLDSLIDEELRSDEGCNPTGLYDLSGVMTHAGSNADSGHWQGWTKQTDGSTSPLPTRVLTLDEWWQFNDNKVTSVPESKILTLDGGGEADTAYSIYPSFIRWLTFSSFDLPCKGISQKIIGAWRYSSFLSIAESTYHTSL